MTQFWSQRSSPPQHGLAGLEDEIKKKALQNITNAKVPLLVALQKLQWSTDKTVRWKAAKFVFELRAVWC